MCCIISSKKSEEAKKSETIIAALRYSPLLNQSILLSLTTEASYCSNYVLTYSLTYLPMIDFVKVINLSIFSLNNPLPPTTTPTTQSMPTCIQKGQKLFKKLFNCLHHLVRVCCMNDWVWEPCGRYGSFALRGFCRLRLSVYMWCPVVSCSVVECGRVWYSEVSIMKKSVLISHEWNDITFGSHF